MKMKSLVLGAIWVSAGALSNSQQHVETSWSDDPIRPSVGSLYMDADEYPRALAREQLLKHTTPIPPPSLSWPMPTFAPVPAKPTPSPPFPEATYALANAAAEKTLKRHWQTKVKPAASKWVQAFTKRHRWEMKKQLIEAKKRRAKAEAIAHAAEVERRKKEEAAEVVRRAQEKNNKKKNREYADYVRRHRAKLRLERYYLKWQKQQEETRKAKEAAAASPASSPAASPAASPAESPAASPAEAPVNWDRFGIGFRTGSDSEEEKLHPNPQVRNQMHKQILDAAAEADAAVVQKKLHPEPKVQKQMHKIQDKMQQQVQKQIQDAVAQSKKGLRKQLQTPATAEAREDVQNEMQEAQNQTQLDAATGMYSKKGLQKQDNLLHAVTEAGRAAVPKQNILPMPWAGLQMHLLALGSAPAPAPALAGGYALPVSPNFLATALAPAAAPAPAA